MTETEQSRALLGLTAQIVSAHVQNNTVPAPELPALIQNVYKALSQAGVEKAEPEKPAAPAAPKKTIFPDYIICLEDGRKLKTLKRHLRSTYDLSPEQYREKWGLPADYPMVAPNYAEHRSALAKRLGLGRKPAEAEAEGEVEVAEAPEPAPRAMPKATLRDPEPRRAEPTLASVFSKFPAADAEPEEPEATEAAPRKKSRTPFSKQLARNMRP
jgi:predicted transcriptional regulator